ncbi:transposable element Tc1 transposase [Trichonephila clavipes]|nr:transposable element Tc1 transposase [Trichonephila clavipes]
MAERNARAAEGLCRERYPQRAPNCRLFANLHHNLCESGLLRGNRHTKEAYLPSFKSMELKFFEDLGLEESSCSVEQFHIDASLTEVDRRAPNNSKVTSARDDRHLLHMAVSNRTVSSKLLAVRWSTVTGVLMSASSIRRRLLHRYTGSPPFTANHRQLRLQWAHEHRVWQADWHQVVFSDESSFNLLDHDGRIRVRHYAGECCLPECVIE